MKDFDGLVAAKEKQINALTKEIEDNTAHVGDGGVKLCVMKEDLEDTEKSLVENKAFLAELEKSCLTKEDKCTAHSHRGTLGIGRHHQDLEQR